MPFEQAYEAGIEPKQTIFINKENIEINYEILLLRPEFKLVQKFRSRTTLKMYKGQENISVKSKVSLALRKHKQDLHI